MKFKEVCPQFVEIDADWWDFLSMPLA